MDFPHPINPGRELPEVTVRSPASQDRMVAGARWARGGPGVGWVSSGGTFGPSLPLTKVIIFRLSTLCSIKVWVFKIQLVKHKPLKYNTIFVSLFGTFFFKIYKKPKNNESGPVLSPSWQTDSIGLR